MNYMSIRHAISLLPYVLFFIGSSCSAEEGLSYKDFWNYIYKQDQIDMAERWRDASITEKDYRVRKEEIDDSGAHDNSSTFTSKNNYENGNFQPKEKFPFVSDVGDFDMTATNYTHPHRDISYMDKQDVTNTHPLEDRKKQAIYQYKSDLQQAKDKYSESSQKSDRADDLIGDWVPSPADPLQNGGFVNSPDNGSPVPYRLNGHPNLERKLPWQKDD